MIADFVPGVTNLLTEINFVRYPSLAVNAPSIRSRLV